MQYTSDAKPAFDDFNNPYTWYCYRTVARVTPPGSGGDYGCSCVLYVRSQTGLPGGPATAAGYTESVMNSFGWHRIVPPGNGTIPADGAIMVMDAGAKGADSSAGHMAIVRGNPSYNYSTQKWSITVDEVDWFGNCNVSRDTTPLPGTERTANWGDLYGINFYRPN